MTIKIEREALLQALESQPTGPPLEGPLPSGSGYLLVDFRKPISPDDFVVEKIRSSTSDDDDSILTISTASLSDSDDSDDSVLERRVSFAEDLVTDEWTRPYTPREEVSSLFYSNEDTQR